MAGVQKARGENKRRKGWRGQWGYNAAGPYSHVQYLVFIPRTVGRKPLEHFKKSGMI